MDDVGPFRVADAGRHVELEFAAFLEDCPHVVLYSKNYHAVRFKLDYVRADGGISNYYPDFVVKLGDGRLVIVETKGQEDLDVPEKLGRLRQWCDDVNRIQGARYHHYVVVDSAGFEKYRPRTFEQLLEAFTQYQPQAA